MENNPQVPDLYVQSPHHHMDFRLNTLMSTMSDLERSGLIEDPAVAHEQAIAADPHMTAAIGHLVVASERHAAYHRYSVGMAPFPAALAPFQSFREHRQVVKATASVRAAYEATADIN